MLYINIIKKRGMIMTEQNKKSQIQKNSLETWLLMEACNISSRENEKVNLTHIKEQVDLNKII